MRDKDTKEDVMYISVLNRKIARPITRVLIKTPVTPNQITMIGLLFAVLSSFFFSFGVYLYTIAAIVLLKMNEILDYVDGSLARMKSKTSLSGDFLEFLVDRITFILVFLGLGWGLFAATGIPMVWFLCFLIISMEMFYETLFLGIRYRYLPKTEVRGTVMKSPLLRMFNYYPHNVYLLLMIFAIIDQMFIFLYITAAYGLVFCIFSTIFFMRKISRM